MEYIDPDKLLENTHIELEEKEEKPVMELANRTFSNDDAVAKKAQQEYRELIRQSFDEVDGCYDYWFLFYCIEKQRRLLDKETIDKLVMNLRKLEKTIIYLKEDYIPKLEAYYREHIDKVKKPYMDYIHKLGIHYKGIIRELEGRNKKT